MICGDYRQCGQASRGANRGNEKFSVASCEICSKSTYIPPSEYIFEATGSNFSLDSQREGAGMGASAFGKLPPQDIIGRVRNLRRRQEILAGKISQVEELADGITCDLAQLEEDLEASSVIGSESGRADRRRTHADAKQLLRYTVSTGAFAVALTPRHDGSAVVRIDEGKPFILPPMLADLLSILCMDVGPSGDSFVEWKSLDHVAILLAKKTGKDVTKHALTQLVWRLRQVLFQQGGLNPFLLQSHRRKGLRFALKRQITPVSESVISDEGQPSHGG
jgi:hypothetical protein